MSEKFSATLYNAQQGHTQLLRGWDWAKPFLMAGDGLVLEIRRFTRTLEQNAKFHKMCGDVGRARVAWAGKPRTPPQWKVLFVSGHAIATGEGSDMVPGLENEFVNLRESTALMSVRRSSSLIEYTQAWCVSNGILLPAYGRDWPEEVAA